ncbi:hypothetical protein [Nostoc sp.]|uniref:hypothetical protein n=1 Tax=Nostoc sp. TaxID=1180 RepID=UPI002FF568D9
MPISQIAFTDAKILFISPLSVSRQLLQVGEPAQRTGFSAPLWFVYFDLFLGNS